MLAATREKNESLELVRLALRLTSSHNQAKIPVDLREYFARVIREAKQVSVSPEDIEVETLPESIELAFLMRIYTALSESLGQITGLDMVSPDLAGRLLHDMESDTVYADQLKPIT